MLLQMLNVLRFIADTFIEKSWEANGSLSWKVIFKARYEAQRAAKGAMAQALKQRPLITQSADGLMIFGQYGFIKKPDGCLYILHWDGDSTFEPYEQLSITNREAALHNYCEYALSCIAVSAARESWKRQVGEQSISLNVLLPGFEILAEEFLMHDRYDERLYEAIAP